MFKPFEQRLADSMRDSSEWRITWGADLLAQPLEPASEDRLDNLPRGHRLLERFAAATEALMSTGSLAVVTAPPARDLARISSDTTFKYAGEYEKVVGKLPKSRTLRVASVLEVNRLVAYGIARQTKSVNSIDIIDVDRCSRRSAGVQAIVKCGDAEFAVGLGHVVVVALLRLLPRPVVVDATNPASRYIFKSFGFVKRQNQINPCLLDLVDAP